MNITLKDDDDELDMELTDTQWKDLITHRGGCSCHIVPPCSNCSNPILNYEAIELGFIDENSGETNAVHKDGKKNEI